MSTTITDEDIFLDALDDFRIPCEIECENPAAWIRKCNHCGDVTFYCDRHRTECIASIARIAFHIATFKCCVCHTQTTSFSDLMTWLPMRGAE